VAVTEINPTNCIYIDFECRKNRPPTLLGIRQDHQLVQWILEPALFGAAVAREGLRCGEFSAVADALATDAESRDCRIVGWSFFDRDCIVNCPDVFDRTKEIVTRRYVNAIEVAEPWRKRLRPDWKIDANQLKLYFEATGFKLELPRTVEPEPAQWIKHVQDQIESRGGYGKVTKQTKRDWHHLLIYNSDDCRGLQHVFELASRELAQWNFCSTSTFRVDAEPDPIDIGIGWRQKKLVRLLGGHHGNDWAFITACNPGVRVLSGEENHSRHRALVEAVEQAGFGWITGRGIGADSSRPAAESLFVMSISESKARALGKQFGQLTIVVGQKNQRSRLVPC
jgi:hypothetical protein